MLCWHLPEGELDVKRTIKRLMLCAALVAGSVFFAVPHASACTGDVCDGICNFMNANPKIFKNGCTIR